MQITTSFLLLASLIGAAQAFTHPQAGHEISYLQHRRHHAKAAVAQTSQPRRRSRRSCQLHSSSSVLVAGSPTSSAVDTSVATQITSSSVSQVATSATDVGSSDVLSSSSPVASASGSGSQAATDVETTPSATATTGSSASLSSNMSSAAAASSTGTATKTASDPSSTVSLQDMLMPVKPLSYWTTADDLPNNLPLDNDTLTPTHDIKALKHDYVQQAGKSAMSAFYPKGSWNLSNQPRGGFSFYATGPKAKGIDLTKAKEVTFGYSVYFPEGFDFVKGGKLPGLWGGNDFEGSISCSGGSRNDACFSSRVMWRTDGAGELYTYLPPSFTANDRVCDVPPYSECNPTYGASVGRGSFTFATGAWTTVAMRVKLNDAGKENGELELWANGKSMFIVDGLVIRNSEVGLIWGDQMQTFFGGSTVDWSTPKDQNTYFADFTMAVTETF